MPHFFNKNALTEEQQLRWSDAMAEYARVQEANLLRDFNEMSPAAKVQYRTLMHVPAEEDLLQHMRGTNSLLSIGHTAGEKSALFARLLDGKAALPYPPPTSYSYPWYDLIEMDGPFPVSVAQVPDMLKSVRPMHEEDSLFLLTINQCSWETQSLNGAAQDLLDLDGERCKMISRRNAGSAADGAAELALEARIREAYTRGPEFIVKHSHWSAMKLHLGRTKSSCIRAYAKACMSRAAGFQSVTLSSALETSNLYLNGVVGATISVGTHPKVALEAARVKMGERRAMPGVVAERFSQYFEAAHYESLAKNYEAAKTEFEANPDCRDWVELTTDGWVLEKA